MEKKRSKKNMRDIFGSIFPVKYDFEAMLIEQAEKTLTGVESLKSWLEKVPLSEPLVLNSMEADVDKMRYELEEKLADAFSTPFDRQDIYSLSRQMDYILNYTAETAREMYVFGVEPDDAIRGMADALLCGTRYVVEGVRSLRSQQRMVKLIIRDARRPMHEIEELYISSMGKLFHDDDAMNAMRKREIYHHLRDAGRALRYTADILHKVDVGISI